MKQNCTRYGAGECQGDGGDTCRRCPAKAEADTLEMITAAETAFIADMQAARTLAIVFLVLLITGLGAITLKALERQEQTFQQEARV